MTLKPLLLDRISIHPTSLSLFEHRDPRTAEMFFLFFGGSSAVLELALTISYERTQ